MSLSRTQFWQSAVVGVVFAFGTFAGIHAGRAAVREPAASRPVASRSVVNEPVADNPAALAPAATATVIKACANNKSGALRLATKGKCKSTERAVSWNIAGPRGLKGAEGEKGDRGLRGATGAVSINGDKCSDTQYIGYDGEKWTCVSAPISAFLYSTGTNLSFSTVGQGFKAFSANVASDTGCNKETCIIRLYDVVDHSNCTAQVRGGDVAKGTEVLPADNNVLIDFGSGWQQGQELTISIYCLR